ncbi:MAG: hypothetical protein BWY78_00825 [Alphaproteobacteria bacterium ADurb.Bin438]|nr:MAG: hypothetical protein BWY78_00825 [Alphaproteobacteria bacterium ADurb.Bin438]
MVRDKDEAYDTYSYADNINIVVPVSQGAGAKFFAKVLSDKKEEEKADIIYDCSNSFKDALEALRAGAKVIKVTDDYKAYFKVIDIANKYGAKVITKHDKKPLNFKKKFPKKEVKIVK